MVIGSECINAMVRNNWHNIVIVIYDSWMLMIFMTFVKVMFGPDFCPLLIIYKIMLNLTIRTIYISSFLLKSFLEVNKISFPDPSLKSISNFSLPFFLLFPKWSSPPYVQKAMHPSILAASKMWLCSVILTSCSVI